MTCRSLSSSVWKIARSVLVLIGGLVVIVATPCGAQMQPAVVDVTPVPSMSGLRPIFDVTRFLDLHFDIVLDGGLTGDHIVALELQTPSGHLYQRIEIPMTTEVGGGDQKRRLPGLPNPVPIQLAVRRQSNGLNQWMIGSDLPVAGTSIVNNSIYGRWSLQLYLDGQALECEGDCGFWLYAPPGLSVFRDGFESGTTASWGGQ